MAAPEIVLGVTGSIGAYKAADVIRRLKEHGCGVSCVMTKRAQEFIAPLTLQALSGRKVATDLFSPESPWIVHTALADQANLVLIAPASANILAKLAHGLADDILTCIVLATKAPVLVAPAMNVHMYHHATVQENIKQLRRMGYHFIGPTVGGLACGYEALGHLAEVDDIVRIALQLASRVSPSSGKPVGMSQAAAVPKRSAKPSRRSRPAARRPRRRR